MNNGEPPFYDFVTDSLFARAIKFYCDRDCARFAEHLDLYPEIVATKTGFSLPDWAGEMWSLLPLIAHVEIEDDQVVPPFLECVIERQRTHSPSTLKEDLAEALNLVVNRYQATDYQRLAGGVLVKNGADPNGVDPNQAENSLSLRDPEAAKVMIELGAQVTLGVAAGLGMLDKVRDLFDHANERAKLKALTYSTVNPQPQVVQFLIDRGVDVNSLCDFFQGFDCTGLHHAIFGGSLEIVQMVLNAGADSSIRCETYDANAIETAQYCENDEVTRLIEAYDAQSRNG